MPTATPTPSSVTRTVLLTGAALLAFAGNSILCRLALRGEAIDPFSFTAIRLASGALILLPLILTRPGCERAPWRPLAAAALFAYALAFSLAYVSLDTGTGSLLLFGAVQITMIGSGVRAGERPTKLAAVGILVAIAGVAWLVSPGVTAPDPTGAVLMVIAGIAWGIYSLIGRNAQQPARATARNFLLAAPIALAVLAAGCQSATITATGAWLAIAAGTATSGIGYVLWYMALPGHSATSAAVVQLTVPLLATAAGVALLGEATSARLVVASAMTLGGVATVVLSRRAASPKR